MSKMQHRKEKKRKAHGQREENTTEIQRIDEFNLNFIQSIFIFWP